MNVLLLKYLVAMVVYKVELLSGDAKRKREGSCAGTKGFRAPEVTLQLP